MASATSGRDKIQKLRASVHPDQPGRPATPSPTIEAAQQLQSKSAAVQQHAVRSQNGPRPNTSSTDSSPPCASIAPIWTNTINTSPPRGGGSTTSSKGQSKELPTANTKPNRAAATAGP